MRNNKKKRNKYLLQISDNRFLSFVTKKNIRLSNWLQRLKKRFEGFRLKYGLILGITLIVLLIIIPVGLFFYMLYYRNINIITSLVNNTTVKSLVKIFVPIIVAIWAVFRFTESRKIIVGVDYSITLKRVILQFMTRNSNSAIIKVNNMEVVNEDGFVVLPAPSIRWDNLKDTYPYNYWFRINNEYTQLNEWTVIPGNSVFNLNLKDNENDQRLKTIIFCAEKALKTNYNNIDIRDLYLSINYRFNHKYSNHVNKIPIKEIIDVTFTKEDKTNLKKEGVLFLVNNTNDLLIYQSII